MSNQHMPQASNVHLWYHCHHCQAAPIIGLRHHCLSCPEGPDNDLCATCYHLWLQKKIPHPAPDSYTSGMGIQHHHFEETPGKPADAFMHWLDIPMPAPIVPVFPTRCVVRPIFNSRSDSVIGGYAFAIKHDSFAQPLILTALHVMDELIKKLGIDCTAANYNYSGKELVNAVTDVNLFDVFAPMWMTAPLGTAGPMLVLPEARLGDEEPISHRDIAAFHVHAGSTVNPCRLAQKVPVVGQAVFLAARVEGDAAQTLYKAVVVECTETSMVYRYAADAGKPKYSSGAPMLDEKGHVVGINVGGGRLEQSELGHANHVGNIRRYLSNVS